MLTSPSFAVGSATAHSPMPLANSVSPTGRVSSGPLIAVHRTRLHIHRRDDIVAAAGIKQQILQQIPPSRTLPQMVMRIDDRQFGFENRFVAPVEPIPAARVRWPGLLLRAAGTRPTRHRGEWGIRVGSLIPPLRSRIRKSFNLPQTESG